jgi:hypothetical protein
MDRQTITKMQARSQRNIPLLLPSTSSAYRVKSEKLIKPHRVSQEVPEIVFLTSYPPRQCGIASFSKDLRDALHKKYGNSFRLTVLPLENDTDRYLYPKEISSINTDHALDYIEAAYKINADPNIALVVVQHEFGLFAGNENSFLEFLDFLDKPVAITFHTVFPKPDNPLTQKVWRIGTGGCYDGLELETVNLNQGAESTVSYLLARMAFEENPKVDCLNRME